MVLLSACDTPDPASKNVAACHRQIPACMSARGFIFLGDVAECSKREIDVDNPACYRPAGRP
ncbi:hypothetical protein AYO42_01610 [Rhizomicrobium sp. SCGC AG-212-E05]|nr:hypothetical protein AYO42_01610 [Rhizomicrobium sp. SCGC AG-212-E05]